MNYSNLLKSIVFFLMFVPAIAKAQLSGKEREEFMGIGMATAKQTWWYFNKRLENPLPSQRFFRVYILQLDIWLKDIRCISPRNKQYKGVADKELNPEATIDTFTFTPDEIADWIVVDDDFIVGGFWLRLQGNTTVMKITETAKCEMVFTQAISEDFIAASKIEPEDYFIINPVNYRDFNRDSAISARYEGGRDALIGHMMHRLRRTDYMRVFNLVGTCYYRFIINPDGTISDVRIQQSIGGGSPEIIRYLIRNLPALAPSGDDHPIIFYGGIRFTLN